MGIYRCIASRLQFESFLGFQIVREQACDKRLFYIWHLTAQNHYRPTVLTRHLYMPTAWSDGKVIGIFLFDKTFWKKIAKYIDFFIRQWQKCKFRVHLCGQASTLSAISIHRYSDDIVDIVLEWLEGKIKWVCKIIFTILASSTAHL